MNWSRARKYDKRGKSENAVLAARMSMRVVTIWMKYQSGFPPKSGGKTVRAIWDTTVSLSLGRMLSWTARNVIPPNMMIDNTAIYKRVERAFLASGGLKA